MSELTDNSVVDGAGPFRFRAPELAPGESWTPDLRNREYQGKKRGLSRYLPFDSIGVTNSDGTATLGVTVNGQYEFGVLPNSVETFDQQDVSAVRVVNESGSATIPAGAIEVELVAEPFDADDAALRDAKRSPVVNTLENVTGVDVSGFFGGGR
jgi:uncharacterized protein YaiE (UPF0345 family)